MLYKKLLKVRIKCQRVSEWEQEMFTLSRLCGLQATVTCIPLTMENRSIYITRYLTLYEGLVNRVATLSQGQNVKCDEMYGKNYVNVLTISQ